MPTTMVITTVITADLDVGVDVERVKNYTAAYVRNREQHLVSKLTDQGVEAQVTTSILDINQLLDYLRLHRQEAPVAPAAQATATQPTVAMAPALEPGAMSEADFLAFTLQQLRTGDQAPTVHFSDAALAALEDEQIGEEFSRTPFLY